jgi:hypothetical protein
MTNCAVTARTPHDQQLVDVAAIPGSGSIAPTLRLTALHHSSPNRIPVTSTVLALAASIGH